ncbi:MAG: hypothetical protein ACI81R_002876 [Bradymonadia bacterium]|jgi:hypothetical protein
MRDLGHRRARYAVDGSKLKELVSAPQNARSRDQVERLVFAYVAVQWRVRTPRRHAVDAHAKRTALLGHKWRQYTILSAPMLTGNGNVRLSILDVEHR